MEKTKSKKIKKIILCVLLSLVSAISLFGAVVSYAYFSTVGYVYTADGGRSVAKIGMNISLLFDRIDETKVNDARDLGIKLTDGTTAKYDSDAKWGSAENPYIISDIKHLQNLSVLQNIGYFYTLNIQNNFTDGVYNNGVDIPYFLVCTSDGKPTTIDGTGIEFSPIGSDEYPFYGYVGGAFDKTATATVGGKISDESALANISVVTTDDVTDVGLFSIISKLGDEPEGEIDPDNPTTFNGVPSTVRDVLLYDVCVSVRNPTWEEVVMDHIFSFSRLKGDESESSFPHENHHIGILAGHVEYATVEYVSVYYSDESKVAIDLNHTNKAGNVEANYLSTSGIIGFMYNMNPDYTPSSGDTAGSVGTGSGIWSADRSVGGGIGSGGG
ncbi:MAG: hypothetical protein MJ072_05000, partial [Clostridia bacterium]|nr:hypothetical protein [Clostridia bacterium]